MSDKKFQTIFGLLYKVNEKIDLFTKYNVDDLFECRILSVDDRFRGRGLANALVQESLETAKNAGFKVFINSKTEEYFCSKFWFFLKLGLIFIFAQCVIFANPDESEKKNYTRAWVWIIVGMCCVFFCFCFGDRIMPAKAPFHLRVVYFFLFVSACSSNKICMGFSLCQGVVTMLFHILHRHEKSDRAESPFRFSRRTQQDYFRRRSFSNMDSRRRLKFHIRILAFQFDRHHLIRPSNLWWKF